MSAIHLRLTPQSAGRANTLENAFAYVRCTMYDVRFGRNAARKMEARAGRDSNRRTQKSGTQRKMGVSEALWRRFPLA